MTQEQIQSTLFDHTKQITALQESTKSAHHRIDRMDKLTEAVHALAQSNTALAVEVRLLAQNVKNDIERIEQGQKSQGDRIGALESVPVKKWNALTGYVLCALVTAAVSLFVGMQLL